MPLVEIGSEVVLFMHIPKTGGSSIEDAYKVSHGEQHMMHSGKWHYDAEGRKFALQHLPAKYLKAHKITEDKFDEYIKFTVVRNPYHKIFSRYKQIYRHLDGSFKLDHFRKWFVEDVATLNIDHKMTQTFYIFDDGEQLIPSEDILCFEDYQNEFSKFLRNHDLPDKRLPRKRVGWHDTRRQRDWLFAIKDHMRPEIEAVYGDDFKNFGYDL